MFERASAESELAKSRNLTQNYEKEHLVQPSLLNLGAAYGHEVVDGLGAAVLARDEEGSAAGDGIKISMYDPRSLSRSFSDHFLSSLMIKNQV